MAINQDIKALMLAPGYDAAFISQVLIWQGNNILTTCLKTGTTVESVDFGWLKAFEVKICRDPVEQSAIAEVLTDMDADLAALEARRDKTRALKQAMMQELLTGNTRLPIGGSADA